MNWEKMTPLLPRAPSRAARAIALLIAPTVADAESGISTEVAARSVSVMLMPVSPSGTGKTLRALMASALASRHAAPDRTSCRKSCAPNVEEACAFMGSPAARERATLPVCASFRVRAF